LSQRAEKLKDLRELDPQVLSEIHQAYFTELFRYAQYRVSDPTVAEDIASETYLRLIDAVQNDKGPNSSIRGWLFGTAANLVNDHFRRSYREEELLEEAALDPSSGQDGEAFKRFEQQDYLNVAFNQLTEEQQHVIALRFGSEMSIQDTSTLMGKNENAVKALQYRAIRSLRRELGVEE
jgi:RNA polymerase sigma-70 factor (ECF subfamily)